MKDIFEKVSNLSNFSAEELINAYLNNIGQSL